MVATTTWSLACACATAAAMVVSVGAVPVLYAVAAGPRAEIRSARPGVTLAPVTRIFWAPLASGSASASSLTSVTVASVISWARCWCASVPTTELIADPSTNTFFGLKRPRRTFSCSTRCTDSSIRSSVSSPARTASSTAL